MATAPLEGDGGCPLITPYTTQIGLNPEILEKLYRIRKWDPDTEGKIPLNLGSLMREVIDDGSPIHIREYQKQMIWHHTRLPVFLNGDAVGLGKTIDVIASMCWLKVRKPALKFIILATKSTTYQWCDEIARFSLLRPLLLGDKYNGLESYEARYLQMKDFLAGDTYDVLVAKYTSLVGKRRKTMKKFDSNGYPLTDGKERISQEILSFCDILRPYSSNLCITFDECQKFKSTKTQIRSMVVEFSKIAGRRWGLTATAIKNDLEEFYSIASAMGIEPLGSMTNFRYTYCVYVMVRVSFNLEKPKIQGYRRVKEFKEGIRPFFLGRSQRQVKEPIPRLTTQYHTVDLDDKQYKLLKHDIPKGDYILPPSVKMVGGELKVKDRDVENMMTMLSVYQLVANHPALLDATDEKEFHSKKLSPKEETLLDLLDGEYRGEKVICYTKYRRWIDRLEYITKSGYFTARNFLRITGAESEKTRNTNKNLFQDPASGYDVIFINNAGVEGINLQQASHMILLDVPWSWGDLLQLVGRMMRMSSPHSACTLHIISTKGTIDEYAIDTLRKKRGVFEKILGKSHSAGILENDEVIDLDSGMEAEEDARTFSNMLRAHVKSIKVQQFLSGSKITDARNDGDDYKSVFEEPESHREKISKLIERCKTKW